MRRCLSMMLIVPMWRSLAPVAMRMIISRIWRWLMHGLPMCRRRHGSIWHVWGVRILGSIVTNRALGFIFFVFLFVLHHRVHSIVLVGLALVELLLFSRELFPGVTNNAGDGASLRRDTRLGLLKSQDMRRKKHVVSCLVSLAIRLLVGRLILRHLLLIALAVFACSGR
jgi:hypothetical protein